MFRALGKYIVGALVLCLAVAIAYGLWQRGSKEGAYRDRDQAIEAQKAAEGHLEQTQKALETERMYAQKLQAIATKYEGDKNAIERQAAADLAGLRDGSIRLRQQWQGCESRLSAAGTSAGQSDDGARLREQGAVDIIGTVAACEAQVKGLQAVIRSDRE